MTPRLSNFCVRCIKTQPSEARKNVNSIDSVSHSDTYSLSEGVKYLHSNLDDEKPGIVDNTQQVPSDIGSTIGARSRTYWQPPMDCYFIDLMLDQVKKGNQVDGLFRKQAWMEMIALTNADFGFDYEVDILKK
ncbi:unnamed protein product [Fraxinus pennsylvanica]|uniref:Myb/SANT-like domain-containing protein n=1 Tax=Fraxinus pennsylvanica TaxID=56036 RepID=A0AAD2ECJ5_9LAMI|nr:unnamed protein product [Fraxinus pennsylvanica]